MRYKVIIAAMLVVFAVAEAPEAQARWGSGGGSGGGHHSSGGHHIPKGTYIIKKCKTAACLRKHPSGTYGFVSGSRSRKE